jgi:GNAT superfamily N-acetyltransferase
MTSPIQIQKVISKHDLRTFVKFPWCIYKGDPNWVPPLISERLDYLNPEKNPFYRQAEVALFLARRDRETVGTIAPFINESANEYSNEKVGGFGFFEVIEDYVVAERLLETACDWVKARGMAILRGPTNFSNNEAPGVLIEGADCPPVMLAAHTPTYYRTFLERYGMEKFIDNYAWRAFRSQIGTELENLPPELFRVADAARRRSNVTIRKARFENWEEEMTKAHYLFNITLTHLSDYVPISEEPFRRMADQLRPFLDRDLVLFAETDGRPIGFCVAIPDINRVLIHLNGRLFPLGWLKLLWYTRRIDVVSFKLMGVLEEYRRRGIDALLYLETIKALFAKGYEWLDGSLTSEENLAVNYLAERLGAEQYKHYRIYQMQVS